MKCEVGVYLMGTVREMHYAAGDSLRDGGMMDIDSKMSEKYHKSSHALRLGRCLLKGLVEVGYEDKVWLMRLWL
jgi:hypothetical protein